MPGVPIEVYTFRYRDPVTGKWVRARYKADLQAIAKRYAEWQITGAAEVRTPGGGWFNPHRKIIAHDELMRLEEPEPDMSPTLDAGERFVAAVFLRRYVTWCARRRRYAQMQGAAALYRELHHR